MLGVPAGHRVFERPLRHQSGTVIMHQPVGRVVHFGSAYSATRAAVFADEEIEIWMKIEKPFGIFPYRQAEIGPCSVGVGPDSLVGLNQIHRRARRAKCIMFRTKRHQFCPFEQGEELRHVVVGSIVAASFPQQAGRNGNAAHFNGPTQGR